MKSNSVLSVNLSLTIATCYCNSLFNYLAKNNPEIKKAQNKMLVNQIQPHFIFNTLTSIQNLYDEKNENASLAMNEFC